MAILSLVASGLALTVLLYAKLRRSHLALQARNTELEYVSLHDPVTGLGNRRAIERYVEALKGEAYHGLGISIKRFGLILGSMGHEAGDELVRQIAARLDGVASAHGGQLFRLDGYTFGAILADRRLRVPVATVLDELAAAMAAPFAVGNQSLVAAVCMGAAHYPTHGSHGHEVARCVELARRRAHGEPGNSYALYDEGLMAQERDRLGLESRLSQAIARGELQLHYQPQHALDDGRVLGFEALLRWHSPEGTVLPGVFIPVAEDTGLIVSLGGWVLAEACRQARAWADAGDGRTTVSINISPRQFRHPDFMDTVRRVLQETGVQPASIELEITEGAMMEDGEAAIAQLHALRAMGLKLAIDDFGTGHASLSYLRRFPLNTLKIDQSFVQRLGVHDGDGAIVHALIGLGHTLGMSVTAEGLETPRQEAALRAWGCDAVQGYLHGRPMPASAATGLLRQAVQLG
ncbi:MAG: bifunctional diguanylate cyclase/phosphodiesterase [Burkholderiaceae bacterium]